MLCFSSRVGFGAASSANSLSWISLYEIEHSFLAMDVMLRSLRVYTGYGQEYKNKCACLNAIGPKELKGNGNKAVPM